MVSGTPLARSLRLLPTEVRGYGEGSLYRFLKIERGYSGSLQLFPPYFLPTNRPYARYRNTSGGTSNVFLMDSRVLGLVMYRRSARPQALRSHRQPIHRMRPFTSAPGSIRRGCTTRYRSLHPSQDSRMALSPAGTPQSPAPCPRRRSAPIRRRRHRSGWPQRIVMRCVDASLPQDPF
jgi:hypothetical protein